LSARKPSELYKDFKIPKCNEFPLTKTNSTSDFKSHPEAKVSYLIIFMNLKFLTDFLISGNQVPARTSEPGLHLEYKAGKDA
jgi:hypothetical protein